VTFIGGLLNGNKLNLVLVLKIAIVFEGATTLDTMAFGQKVFVQQTMVPKAFGPKRRQKRQLPTDICPTDN
jgi:hypothetical protein